MFPGAAPEWRYLVALETAKIVDESWRIAEHYRRRHDPFIRDLTVLAAANQAVDEEMLTERQRTLLKMSQIYTQPSCANLRAGLEAYLIAQASDEEIEARLPFNAHEIDCYERCWFNVRPYVFKPQTIVLMVFRGPLHGGSKADVRSLAHKLAFLGGISVVDNHLTLNDYDKVQSFYQQLLVQMVEKKSAEAMMLATLDSQTTPMFVQMSLNLADLQARNNAKKGVTNELEKAVQDFVNQLPLNVADPTITANLQLPAREPRAAEIISQ